MPPFQSLTRRFSRSSSGRRSQSYQSQDPESPSNYIDPPHNNIIHSGPGGNTALPATPTTTGTFPRNSAHGDEYMVLPKGGNTSEGRPISSATDASFDFANRPVTSHTTTASVSRGGGMNMSPKIRHSGVGGIGGNLSRTDQIVLQHFWESKYEDNAKRDLHYLKFPSFPQYPSHKDLLPFCEIYHLVKTSPGATIISLGSANGVYIGFELATGSQLHIDLDDDWFSGPSSTSITHHRVVFRPFESMLSDPGSNSMFKTWPKPLTIEFLEDQYQSWTQDLMSICWEGKEIRELGGSGNDANYASNKTTGPVAGSVDGGGNLRRSAGSMSGRHATNNADDGYTSERSNGLI